MNERDSLFSSRRAFLGRSVVAGGVLALGALTLPAIPAHALDFSTGDARLLLFLLEVQALQSDYFTRASMTTPAQGMTLGEANALNTFAEQDERQKRWCKLALRKFNREQQAPSTMSGGFANRRYTFGAMDSHDSLLREALRVKSAGAAAWMGAAGKADNGEIASAFASLAGVQARHRAVLADALGQPALMAMAPALSLSDATRQLEEFGFKAAM